MNSRVGSIREFHVLDAFRRWWVPVVLALGWHAFWWNWLRVEQPRGRRFGPSTSVIRYAPFPSEQRVAPDLREPVSPMSPWLFALPTRGGFSEPASRQRIGVRPPLAPPLPAMQSTIERLALFPPDEKGWSAVPAWRDDVASALRQFPLRMETEPVYTIPPVTGVSVRIELEGDWAGETITPADIPEWPAELRTQMWEVVAFAQVGSDGYSCYVIFEQCSPDTKFNETLERWLRTRMLTAGRPGRGRLRIRTVMAPACDTATERTQR